MRIIESTAGWLGSMLDGLTEMELYELFDEIAEHRASGNLKEDGEIIKLSTPLAEQLASDIASTNPMVEDSVTFEIARRANNKFAKRMGLV